MTDILAAQAGDFNTPATWTGGVVPGATDKAIANGFAITLSANVTVVSFHTDGSNYAGADGGSFNTSAVCTIAGDAIAGTTTCLTVDLLGCVWTGDGTGGSVSGANGAYIRNGSIQNGNNTGGSVSGAYGALIQSDSISCGDNSTSTVTGAYGTKYESRSKGIFLNHVGADAVNYSADSDDSLDTVPDIFNPFILKPEIRKLKLVSVQTGGCS